MSLWRGGKTFVVGHRGGRGEGWPPENSLAAFERARREGAPAIEIDTRLSADGVVVVFHDPRLTRVTGGNDTRAVAHLSARDLAKVGEIPILGDVLSWCAEHDVALNVEMKRDQPHLASYVRRLAREIKGTRADVLLSSFDPALLLGIGLLVPKLRRAWLTDPRHDRALDLASRAAVPPLLWAMHPAFSQASPERVARWKKRGLRVGTYTVNDPREAQELRARGVDWIITDDPAGIRRALVTRS